MFGSRIGMKPLSYSCRSLATMLEAGVGVQKAFQLAADKTRDPRTAASLSEIVLGISRGEQIAEAMRKQGKAYPELVIDMVDVAEQTGSLPEILKSLADHYENNLRLWRAFLGGIAWPAIQLFAAIFVIALLILLLGWIADSQGGEPIDMLGLGLMGTSGAITWLTITFGSLLALFFGYRLLNKAFRDQRVLDPLLLQVPVLGKCMQSFAIARFSWAFYLTQQSGMPINQSLKASLKATTNGAYFAAIPRICSAVMEGDPLSVALARSRLFPEDFLHMVEVSETSGTVPEALHRLSPQFEDQARRSLAILTAAMGWLVWMVVAAMIVFFIFRIMLWYIGMITDATNMAL